MVGDTGPDRWPVVDGTTALAGTPICVVKDCPYRTLSSLSTRTRVGFQWNSIGIRAASDHGESDEVRR